MQTGTRDALSCMDRHQPTGPQVPTRVVMHDQPMSPDHWSNLTWDTIPQGAMTS